MASHRYKLGDVVSVTQFYTGRAETGHVEIVRLMPASVDGEFHYRVRGPDKVERAVAEGKLSAVQAAST